MTKANPFHEIYNTERYNKPHQFPLAPFPFILDVEVTNYCNLNCLMCGRTEMTRPVGFMSQGMFERIVDEVASHGSAIRLIRFGEPFSHPDIYDMIGYASYYMPIHVTTNGLGKYHDNDRILESGLSSIIFSVQGTDAEEYEYMRKNKGYYILKREIKGLVSLRGERDLPFIQVNSTILDETQEQIDTFLDYWQFVDKVDYWYTSFERLKNVDDKLRARQRVQEHTSNGFRCNEVMTKLSVNWNGDVTACCGDFDGELVVGNILDKSLKSIWQGKAMAKIRNSIDTIPFCKLCTSKF